MRFKETPPHLNILHVLGEKVKHISVYFESFTTTILGPKYTLASYEKARKRTEKL